MSPRKLERKRAIFFSFLLLKRAGSAGLGGAEEEIKNIIAQAPSVEHCRC